MRVLFKSGMNIGVLRLENGRRRVVWRSVCYLSVSLLGCHSVREEDADVIQSVGCCALVRVSCKSSVFLPNLNFVGTVCYISLFSSNSPLLLLRICLQFTFAPYSLIRPPAPTVPACRNSAPKDDNAAFFLLLAELHFSLCSDVLPSYTKSEGVCCNSDLQLTLVLTSC